MLFSNELIKGIEEWNLFENLEEEQSDATGWARLGLRRLLPTLFHVRLCQTYDDPPKNPVSP